ncbi:MAG: CapA family protein [Chloroflexota bacterium]
MSDPQTDATVDLPTAVFPPPTPPVSPDAEAPFLPTPTLAPGATLPATEPASEQSDPTPEGKDAHLVPQPPPATADASGPGSSIGRYTLGTTANVPIEIIAAAQQTADANPELFAWVGAAGNELPDVLLSPDGQTPLASWVYTVAAPFATVTDDVSWPSVTTGWQTGQSELGSLLIPGESAAALEHLLGGSTPAQTLGEDRVGGLWAARPSWTILPFDQLRPEFKVLSIDGISTLAHDFDATAYPLTATIGLSGDEDAVAAFLSTYNGPTTNRNPNLLTRVAMTGVTALVRATAFQMEQNGMLWPGEEVAPVLQSADIAHVSNEVSFTPDCPFPDPYGGTTFCSNDRYFELLESLGIDVIELTGNHVNDYGREPLAHTLDLYAGAGMDWFGGGRNLADASRAAEFSHNGNRIAFVGCNPVGPANAWATADAAGSRPCGPDMQAQISQLRDEGYVVIATLQYTEYYQYPPTPQQEADFAELAQAGAAAVSGSQGHHAQSFAFDDGSFVHYGLGNLFFDQMDMLGTRQSLVDTYVIYDGRLVSVELWTGLIENWARPRLMTPEERAETLQALFQASGW